MILTVQGVYLDGSQPAGLISPPARPLVLPYEVDALVRLTLVAGSGAPHPLPTVAGSGGVLTVREALNPGSAPVLTAAGTANPKLGRSVMDFILPATAFKPRQPGLFYYDVLMLGLDASVSGISRDLVVGTSALRVVPSVSRLPGS